MLGPLYRSENCPPVLFFFLIFGVVKNDVLAVMVEEGKGGCEVVDTATERKHIHRSCRVRLSSPVLSPLCPPE